MGDEKENRKGKEIELLLDQRLAHVEEGVRKLWKKRRTLTIIEVLHLGKGKFIFLNK